MALQHVVDDIPNPRLSVPSIGARAAFKYSPAGGKPTYRTSTLISVPGTNLFTTVVPLVPAVPNHVIVVKAVQVKMTGNPGTKNFGNNAAVATEGFLGTNFGAGIAAVAAVPAVALATNGALTIGYGSVAGGVGPVIAAPIATLPATFAIGPTSDFYAAEPTATSAAGTLAEANVVNLPVSIVRQTANFTNGPAFLTVTVDYELRLYQG